MLVTRTQLVAIRHIEIMRRFGLTRLLSWYETFEQPPLWVDSSTYTQRYSARRPQSDEEAAHLVAELRVYCGELVINPSWVPDVRLYSCLQDLAVKLVGRDGLAAVA